MWQVYPHMYIQKWGYPCTVGTRIHPRIIQHTRTHTPTHTHTHTQMYTRTHTHTHKHTRTYTPIFTRTSLKLTHKKQQLSSSGWTPLCLLSLMPKTPLCLLAIMPRTSFCLLALMLLIRGSKAILLLRSEGRLVNQNSRIRKRRCWNRLLVWKRRKKTKKRWER